MVMKHCPACEETKHLDEFYRRGKYLQSYCKVCQRAHTKRNYKNLKILSLAPNIVWHKAAMNALLRLRIPVVSGRPMFNCDLIAYGCVRINLKKTHMTVMHTSELSFKCDFTPTEQLGLTCDVLAVWHGEDIYLFDRKTPAFYHNGELKSGFSFNRYPLHGRKRERGIILEDKDIRPAHRNITLINQKLHDYQEAIGNGFVDTSTIDRYIANKER
jgi:hypothetical protein